MSNEKNLALEEVKVCLHELADELTEGEALLLFHGDPRKEDADSVTGSVIIRGSVFDSLYAIGAIVSSVVEGHALTPVQSAEYLKLVNKKIREDAAASCARVIRGMDKEEREAALAEMLSDVRSMLSDALSDKEEDANDDD